MIEIINLYILIILYNKLLYCAYGNKIYKTMHLKRLYLLMILVFDTSLDSVKYFV